MIEKVSEYNFDDISIGLKKEFGWAQLLWADP